MDNKFDIIIQALSENTLSENASADYHYDSKGNPEGYFATASGYLADDSLKRDAVIRYYNIYEDWDAHYQEGAIIDKHDGDRFAAYGYEENNEGIIVPVLYKHDFASYSIEEEGMDYGDAFYYVGTQELNGTTYDKWRKIESGDDLDWDSAAKKYILTNIIVKDGAIIEEVKGPYLFSLKTKANIPAWKLKYCLDNDTTRFAWADEERGRGVIYWMKDEHNNECPYDFKNIQFRRDSDWQTEHSDFIEDLGISVGDVEWFYTFSWVNEDLEVEDLTLRQDLTTDDPWRYGTHNNIIKETLTEDEIGALWLNHNLFINTYYYLEGFFLGCYQNKIENNSNKNTFGNECFNNSLGAQNRENIFNSSCYDNELGHACWRNRFKSSSKNTLNYECYFNRLLNSRYTIFGNNCRSNEINYSRSNTFGQSCSSITILGNEDNPSAYITAIGNCNDITINNELGNTHNINLGLRCAYLNITGNKITVCDYVIGTQDSPLTLEGRDVPTVFEAPGTTHIILD